MNKSKGDLSKIEYPIRSPQVWLEKNFDPVLVFY
jgi:hypothetical protein